MTDRAGTNDWRKDAVALGLAGGGGFLILLAVLTLRAGEVPTGGGALPALARATVGMIGLVPALLAGIATAGAGTWLYLTGRREGVLRHVAGALCTAAGLSVLLGALSAEAGGLFGELTGGTVSGLATKAGGAIFGVVVLAAPVWMFWLRERVDLASLLPRKDATRHPADAEAQEAGVSALEAEALAPAPAAVSAGTLAPDLQNPYPEDVRLKGELPPGTLPLDADGYVQETEPISDAGPDELPDRPHDASVHRWTPERGDAADEPAGEDLAAPHDAARRGASWERWDDAADASDVAAAGTAEEPELSAAVEPEEEPVEEAGEVRPLEPAALETGDADDPFAAHTYAAADLAEAPGAPAAADAPRAVEPYQPPRPSWEVEDEDEALDAPVPDEVAEALEDPEDAAAAAAALPEDEATPRAATVETESAPEMATEPPAEEAVPEVDAEPEAMHAAATATEEAPEELDVDELEEGDGEEPDAARAEDAEEEDDDSEWEWVEEPEEDAEEVRAETDEEDDDDEYEWVEVPDDEAEETYAEADDAEADEESEDVDEEEPEETYAEDDEDEADDDEYEYVYEDEDEDEPAETYAEADDEADDEDAEEEEEADAEEEPEEAYAESDDEEEWEYEEVEEPEEELEEEPDAVRAEAEDTGEDAAAAADAHDGRQMDLFDDPAPAADAGESEPEVVLAPTAAGGDAARKAAAGGVSAPKVSAEMLVDAGNLFLRENRVAVSMLQKRFDLDFDRSCQILDELQELGLIGPFVDGARRDILMSSEEWLELTGQSS